jgi:hypothetical protein
MLRLYGPEANPARGKLLQFAERKTTDLFPESLQDVRVNHESTYEVLQQVEYLMLELDPPDPRRRWFLQQALLHAAKIGNTHWLLGQVAGQGTPKVFVAVLVFWLSQFRLVCAAQFDIGLDLGFVRSRRFWRC